ncbi:MAG: hypothetical protein M1325_02470 [Actinobacteria bacterium]|nr:hypothetical protein [Actinomycetota bacterium]
MTTTDSGIPGTTGAAVTHPTGADDLVFRVEVGGGLVPQEALFTNMPYLSIYGDGRVITPGPVIEIYPPPALPSLQVAKLSEEGLQKLLTAAAAVGLLEEGVDYGRPAVADGSTTTFTLAAEGRTVKTAVYFLDYENQDDQALTEPQKRRRQALLDFQSRLGDLRGWMGGALGPETSYEVRALAVLILPGDPTQKDPSGLERRVLEWPLADLGSLGEPYLQGKRAVLTGGDLAALRPLLLQADTLTLWKSGAGYYTLLLRPLLPDEAKG